MCLVKMKWKNRSKESIKLTLALRTSDMKFQAERGNVEYYETAVEND